MEVVCTVGSSKKPLGFRTALCPTACELVDGCSVLNLDKVIILLFFTFLLGFVGFYIIF